MGLALPDKGVSVLIATTDADGPRRLPVEIGATLSWQGIPAIFFRRQWSEAFKYSGPLAEWLGDHVADFDVVHVHAVFSHACLAASQACRRSGVPYVVRPLGTLDPWSLRQKPMRKRLLWQVGVRRMLDGAAAIHYTTAAEQRLAEKPLGLRRGVVIPLGVAAELLGDPLADQHEYEQNHPFGSQPYVLVLGRLHPKKGLESFIEIFLQLANTADYRQWRLVVAGDGEPDYVASLKRLIHQQRGEDKIFFAGWLGGLDKMVALRGAALLALPSRQENFGLVVAEALACGTPVLVSTQVNLADEITAAKAGWVAPLERAAWLETLSHALRDDDERARRGLAGRELARARFTWPGVATELARLYGAVRAQA
jgi:glycosyltransferase involved in cell wall biosynthesis